MASAILFSLLQLIVGLCHATDYNILDFGMARKQERWMAEHGRVYVDGAERARRFEIFKANVEYIEGFNNAARHNYTLGVNKFADLTSEEFMSTYTCRVKPGAAKYEELLESIGYETEEPLNSTLINEVVDWRPSMTPVKDQGECGSCYIFATIATIESIFYIERRGSLRSLSAQQVLDCDDANQHGCRDGGSRSDVYDYVIENRGLTTDDNYPYKAVEGKCDKKKEAAVKAYINSYKKVDRRSEKALMSAVYKRPVAVRIAVPRQWQFYNGGIFPGPCPKEPDHKVVVAGYGQIGDTKYWLVRNSWGKDWGEGGYIKIKKDIADADGLCGIVSDNPMYPTM